MTKPATKLPNSRTSRGRVGGPGFFTKGNPAARLTPRGRTTSSIKRDKRHQVGRMDTHKHEKGAWRGGESVPRPVPLPRAGSWHPARGPSEIWR